MEFKDRLVKLRKELGLTQEDFAQKIGYTRTAISAWEIGRNEPSNADTVRIAEFFGVSTDYLLCKTDIRNNVSNIDDSNKRIYMCPVYGQISAGQPNWAEECIEGRIPLDPDLMGIINPEEHYFLRVNGRSMDKIIRDGAFALIHKQDMVEDGEIAVVLVNGSSATLKKFTRQGELVILEPQSTDSSYTTQVYDKTTPIKILGKYVGKMEINK